jgi:dihydrofolate reductase
MAELYVSEFVSLDGVMEAPGGEDFKYPGWSFDFERGEEGDQFKLEETLSTDHSLLGRRTYEGFAAAWPEREGDEEEGDFAKKLNEMPKYVVSSTITEPSWVNTTVISGDVPAEIAKLKEELDGRIGVAGSQQLVQTLFEHDLVDEVRLMVFPVILGTGKRLFGETPDKLSFSLKELRPVGPAGVGVAVYERAR